jgi:hypothetical protein
VYSISSTAVPPPTIVGGEATEAVQVGGNFGNGPGTVVGAILEVNGILYMSAPDNAWAVDALDGTVIPKAMKKFDRVNLFNVSIWDGPPDRRGTGESACSIREGVLESLP